MKKLLVLIGSCLVILCLSVVFGSPKAEAYSYGATYPHGNSCYYWGTDGACYNYSTYGSSYWPFYHGYYGHGNYRSHYPHYGYKYSSYYPRSISRHPYDVRRRYRRSSYRPYYKSNHYYGYGW